MSDPTRTDSIYRAMTDDGSFRVVAAQTTHTASGILTAQQVKGTTAKHLADLATGVTLIRETMSPGLRVQGILKRQEQSGYLLADSHPSGDTRGLAAVKDNRDDFVLDNAVLQMMRTLHNGRVQQGVIAINEGASVSSSLMAYMQDSEQITTMIVASSVFTDHEAVRAGGYLVQLLPGVDHGVLAIMTERLEDFRDIDAFVGKSDFTPKSLVAELLYGMPFTELHSSELRYRCWCSRASMLSAIASLGRSEVQSMVDDGEVLEINCDYCARDYRVPPAELRGLLDDN